MLNVVDNDDSNILSNVNISEKGIIISNTVFKFSEFAKSIIKKNENLNEKFRKNFTFKSKRRKAVNQADIEMMNRNILEMNSESHSESSSDKNSNKDTIENSLETNQTEEKKENTTQDSIEKTKLPRLFSKGNSKDEEDVLRIRNEWFVKIRTIVTFFFKFEYKLISFFIPEKGIFLKTDMATLFFVKIFLQLSLSAILSPENSLSGDEDTSSSVFIKLT